MQPAPNARSLRAFLARHSSMASMLLMVIFVGMGEKMAERFLPLYLMALGGSTWSVGFLNAMDNLLGALYSFPGGYLADRLGPRRSLRLFTLIAMAGYAIVILIPAWQAVLAGSVLFISWTAVSLPAIMSLVSAAVPKSRRTFGVSLHSFVRRIPMALGPIVGGILIGLFGQIRGVRIAFAAAFAMALVSLYVIQRFMKDTPPQKPAADSKTRKADTQPPLQGAQPDTSGRTRNESSGLPGMPQAQTSAARDIVPAPDALSRTAGTPDAPSADTPTAPTPAPDAPRSPSETLGAPPEATPTAPTASPEAKPARKTASPFRQKLSPWLELFSPNLRSLLASDILIRFAEQIPYAFVVVWAVTENGLSPLQFGILTTIEMVTAMIVYIPVAWLADRYGKKRFVLLTFGFFTLFPLVLLFSKSFTAFVIAFIVRGLKEFGEPTRKALIMDLAPEDAKAKTFGAYYLLRDIVVAAAALLSAPLWNISPAANFLTAFAFGVAGTLFFAIFGKDIVASKEH